MQSAFDAAFAAADAEILDLFGVEATYTGPSGPSQSVRVILTKDVERTVGGMDSQVAERRTEISFASARLEPARGGRFVIGGHAWDWMSQVEDDGHMTTGVVRDAGQV